MAESYKFTVHFKDEDSGDWKEGGIHSFAVRPLVGEYMRIKESHGATHLHRIAAIAHPDHVSITCGELFLVDCGEESKVMRNLSALS